MDNQWLIATLRSEMSRMTRGAHRIAKRAQNSSAAATVSVAVKIEQVRRHAIGSISRFVARLCHPCMCIIEFSWYFVAAITIGSMSPAISLKYRATA
jgi:hypothetical protein